jgi:SAM-dependent methyltransferase
MTETGITNEAYWTGRYAEGNIPWDAGSVTTPIKEYADQLISKDLRILIPGAGNAYEAEYLWKQGFVETYVVDLSEIPLKALKIRCPDFPDSHLIHDDFFSLQGKYDLIIEQTFFCALHPQQRTDYVTRMLQLLKPGGKLVGVLFDDPLFTDHPPYGGNMEIYRSFFFPSFEELVFERCYNSIPPRTNRELFILLRKPDFLSIS